LLSACLIFFNIFSLAGVVAITKIKLLVVF
jgi:hypothetical protein